MGRAPSPCNSITEKELEKKKGPWTPEEDRKLFAYIQIYGHGSWPSLPSKAGHFRAEEMWESCRLRWINYLKPDIKRGNFSLKEEQTIIQLHALLGNRWSAIANHLPKRTDNEIKNYWNTRIKKNLTKSGIDPTTHKPIITHGGSLLGSGQTKDASNLIGHRAQWEIARLEAEARLSTHYRRSKTLMSDKYDPNCRLQHGYPNSSARDQLVGNMPALISPRPQPQQPLCLDHVPSAWRRIMSSSQSSNNAFTVWSSLENSDFLDSTDALSCPIIDQCTRAISDNPSTAEILTNIIQNDAETLKPNDDINDLRDTIKEKLQENPIMIHNPFNCFSEEGFGTESWSDGGDGDFEILENWNTSVLMSNLADYNSPLGTPIYWEPELFQ